MVPISAVLCLQTFLQDVILGTFSTPWLSMVLMLAYTVFLLIIAFNMLVGIMMDTFARVWLKEDMEVLRAKVGAKMREEQFQHWYAATSATPGMQLVDSIDVWLCRRFSCCTAHTWYELAPQQVASQPISPCATHLPTYLPGMHAGRGHC